MSLMDVLNLNSDVSDCKLYIVAFRLSFIYLYASINVSLPYYFMISVRSYENTCHCCNFK